MSCGLRHRGDCARLDGSVRQPPGADHHNHTLVGAHRLAWRALAFVQTRRRKSIRAAVCCSNAASSAERAASALQKRSATLWPLVKALIRENRRDIDRKKLTATLQSVVDRKNHDGNGTIAYQLHTRRGRREHGAGICRRLLSELSRPVWKSTSASVPPRLHAIEQRLPSSRRR